MPDLGFSSLFVLIYVPRSGLMVDAVEAGSHGVVEAVVCAIWFDGFEPRHPIVFSVFKQVSVLHFRVLVVISDLFN